MFMLECKQIHIEKCACQTVTQIHFFLKFRYKKCVNELKELFVDIFFFLKISSINHVSSIHEDKSVKNAILISF